MKEKTNRHLRLRELLQENSMEANLIVMLVVFIILFINCKISDYKKNDYDFKDLAYAKERSCFGTTLHGMAGGFDEGYASLSSSPRESHVSFDILFVTNLCILFFLCPIRFRIKKYPLKWVLKMFSI